MSVNQAKTVNDDRVLKLVRALANMYKKKAELKMQMDELDEKIPKVESSIHKKLGDGAHKVHNWAVKIMTKIQKGRASTSWKAIAESNHKQLEIVKNNLCEAHEYSEEIVDAINTFFVTMNEHYDTVVEQNTKQGDDKEKTNIELMRL